MDIVSTAWKQNKIKRWRQFRGVTQRAFAGRVKMTYTRYGQVERGESEPTPPEIVRIVRALGVKVEDVKMPRSGHDPRPRT
jgi:transcriptional regulator with XRE-family HTH domain